MKKPSLDDVYLSFTGRHLRDGDNNGSGRKEMHHPHMRKRMR